MICGDCEHFSSYNAVRVRCNITGKLRHVGEKCNCLVEAKMIPEESLRMVNLVDLSDESVKRIADEIVKRLKSNQYADEEYDLDTTHHGPLRKCNSCGTITYKERHCPNCGAQTVDEWW